MQLFLVCSYYGVWQKYLTIWQHSCEWNHWHGEFVLERASSETQSISVAIERWSVEHWGFCCENIVQKQRFCHDSVAISLALQYSSEQQCPFSQYCTAVGEKLQRNSVCHEKKTS